MKENFIIYKWYAYVNVLKEREVGIERFKSNNKKKRQNTMCDFACSFNCVFILCMFRTYKGREHFSKSWY